MSRPESPYPSPETGLAVQRPAASRTSGRIGRDGEGFLPFEGGEYYRIAGYDRMPPFLMSLASDADLWMFVASGGGLTAGRVDAEGSLFPYETVDKLHDAHHHSGPVTLLRVRRGGGPSTLWEPFAAHRGGDAGIERNLYKNATGNRLVFEEVNEELDLVFRYRWAGCDPFGWVRTATIENRGSGAVSVDLLDGLRNVLPWGVPLALYQRSSSLVDAYKRTDCDPETGLAVFSITAMITDRAEAAEVLRANSVWCCGLRRFTVALSPEAIAAFRSGKAVPSETTLTGRRGNYLVASTLDLASGGRTDWHLVADVGRSHAQLAGLRTRLQRDDALDRAVRSSLRESEESLRRIVAGADGLQLTGHPATTHHHFANVLFNAMRGGVFTHDYDLPLADFVDFLETRNRKVAAGQKALLGTLPEEIRSAELIRIAERSQDADLERLSYEYLPLWFGRRHGDPSRPWNRFTIRVKNPDGTRALRYEGNWRDIFQNWEALGMSFPEFLPGIAAKFVNASTVDGFNPYRISRDGIDWEVVDPRDPWSYIGYWGDHQIVYLLRFLEAMQRFLPGTLETLAYREIFAYADVPYRLKPYDAILANPRATILYDTGLAAAIEERVRALGSDGKLLPAAGGGVYRACLLEKLLVPALSKLSNFVPEGGIWMNTQRPEWNDANNALVGNGVSVVTLCHLRRYLAFLRDLSLRLGTASAPVSAEVIAWFHRLHAVFTEHRAHPDSATRSDADRKRFLDALGRAFGDYRERVYAGGFSGKSPLAAAEVAAFCRDTLAHVDSAIQANRREDGLYHAYNLLRMEPGGTEAGLGRLDEMLEGQVAALSSGLVDPPEAVRMVDALFRSRLYRADQRSFLLYPARSLPEFLERNIAPEEAVRAVPLITELLAAGDTSILERDAQGQYRFSGDVHNRRDVEDALDRIAKQDGWQAAVARDRRAVLALFETVFNHHAFTGRSGTMYGYEGLGCIYWHMVTKLLLAVQEVALRGEQESRPVPVREALREAYYRIRSGLGFEKTAAEYGAFPTDPYSHTPAHAGAQQPGMTGQVKEEILTRFGELGIHVENGILSFRPRLLRKAEFLGESATFGYIDLKGSPRAIDLEPGSLAFTFCQVPVVYRLTQDAVWIRVIPTEGEAALVQGDALDAKVSGAIFGRTAMIDRLEVGVPEISLAGF